MTKETSGTKNPVGLISGGRLSEILDGEPTEMAEFVEVVNRSREAIDLTAYL